jgi:hypothetical protein
MLEICWKQAPEMRMAWRTETSQFSGLPTAASEIANFQSNDEAIRIVIAQHAILCCRFRAGKHGITSVEPLRLSVVIEQTPEAGMQFQLGVDSDIALRDTSRLHGLCTRAAMGFVSPQYKPVVCCLYLRRIDDIFVPGGLYSLK